MTARSFPFAPARRAGLTRRQLLRGAGGAAVLAAAGGVGELLSGPASAPVIESFASPSSGPTRGFRSRPDLRPPSVTAHAGETVELSGNDAAPGFLFLAPGPLSTTTTVSQSGPLIIDRQGEPVWFRPLPAGIAATNFEVSHYRGEPVLTWWEGKIAESGYGLGEGVIVDRHYRELARVRAANGRHMDLHEFRLTPDGTALLTCYPDEVTADLSSIGGSRHGKMLAPIVQEVDVASGRLLFEWRSLEHVPVTDSYRPIEKTYDYLHLNSVSPSTDGNLLVSGRHTWAVYKVERRTGKVLWTLGGKRSQFRFGPGARFTWQHDARQVSDQILTVFDNGSDGATNSEHQSRGLMLEVNERSRTARLARVYTNPKSLLSAAMGSVQVLPSGRVIVGWGDAPYTSEFAQTGTLIADAGIPSGLFSYRAFSFPWQSVPGHRPAIAVGRDELTGAKLVYASWNGATEVAGWRVDAGPAVGRTRLIGIAMPRGFETVIPLDPTIRYASIAALDASDRVLRRSATIQI